MMKKLSLLILVLLLSQLAFAPLEPARAGNTWYVSPSGSGNDCSQANPCQIDNAVQLKSSSNDTILAKEGNYYAPYLTDSYVMYIYKSLQITGSCEWETTGPVVCHPETYSSNIRADNEMRGIVIQGSPGDGMTVLIEGFTILQGNGEGVVPGSCSSVFGAIAWGCGGGIFAEGVDHLELRNNFIWANFASRSSTTSEISLGGGIYAEDVGHLVMKNNTLQFNQAASQGRGYGGGIYIEDSGEIGGVLIEDNLFYGNELTTNADELDAMGAGILAINSTDIQVNNNNFLWQENIIQRSVYGSAIFFKHVENSYIYNNEFHRNYGKSTIRIEGVGDGTTIVTIQRNKIVQEDTATNIEIWGDAEVLIMNNFIGTNNPIYWGGYTTCVYSKGDGSSGEPDVYFGFNTCALTAVGFWVDEESIITADSNILTQISDIAIYIAASLSTPPIVTENLFHDNLNNGVTGAILFTGDPLLVNPTSGDFHIQPGSAAIDKVYSWQGGI
ncbi:MAG: hypothetical protein MUO40_13555, partial [Anaerolineaceae bacterium]|nr:hypothetical protein [Anaerolineaceae bacterium]